MGEEGFRQECDNRGIPTFNEYAEEFHIVGASKGSCQPKHNMIILNII